MTTLADSRTLTLVRSQVDQPVDLLGLWATSSHDQKAYWAIPDEGFEFVALGRARHFRTEQRRDRFQSVRATMGDLQVNLVGEPGPEFSGGVLVGGFAFSDRELERHPDWAVFGGGELVLPEIFVVRSNDSFWITHVDTAELPDLAPGFDHRLGQVKEVDHKDDQAYLRLVGQALAEINAGTMDLC